MAISSINTFNHSHNNNPTKQKTCPTIVSNPIYRYIKITNLLKKSFIYLFTYI